MLVKELREKSDQELALMLEDLRATLFSLRNERRETGKVEKPHQVVETKRTIARIKTIQNEKKRSA